jgi:hypothetical protein
MHSVSQLPEAGDIFPAISHQVMPVYGRDFFNLTLDTDQTNHEHGCSAPRPGDEIIYTPPGYIAVRFYYTPNAHGSHDDAVF